jgi:hypothetical protein
MSCLCTVLSDLKLHAEAEPLDRELLAARTAERESRLHPSLQPPPPTPLHTYPTSSHRAPESRSSSGGASDEKTIRARLNLAITLDELEKHEEAVSLCRSVVELYRRTEGPRALNTNVATTLLAEFLIRQGKPAEARDLERRSSLRLRRGELDNYQKKRFGFC